MNILFLHGLESKLSDEKRKELEKYGNVVAPDINYRRDHEIISDLSIKYGTSEIKCIIGSSMGGFAGFYLSMLLDIPTLLFNPALPYRSVRQEIPEYDFIINQSIQLILGERDDVIRATDTETFLHKHYPNNIYIRTRKLPQLEHRIPFNVFRQEVAHFMKSI